MNITINEMLEVIASKTNTREDYTKYLTIILEYMEVISIVKENSETMKPLKMLAETFAVASIASNGGYSSSIDQPIYDLLRQIAHTTALNKEIDEPLQGTIFDVKHASMLIKDTITSNKNLTGPNSIETLKTFNKI